jgi:hypothetical protein
MERDAYIALNREWEEKQAQIRKLKKEANDLADRIIAASIEPDTPLINFGVK